MCEDCEATIKKLQKIAKDALDKLPARWNLGFQAGLKQAIPYEKELLELLNKERQARKDDNASLTKDILRLEEENYKLSKIVETVRRYNISTK